MKIAIGVISVFLVILLFAGLFPSCYIYNTLNAQFNAVKTAESHYGAALDLIPEKIKGTWQMKNEEQDFENKTFVDYAKARSGVLQQMDEFKQMMAEGQASQKQMTQSASEILGSLQALQSKALSIQVQIERTPTLQGAEVTKLAMASLEEGTNEIKTALDDWIKAIQDYNEYRGRFDISFYASFFSRFPANIEYYQGTRKSFHVDDVQPER